MRRTVVISNGTYPLPPGLIDASTRLIVADGGLGRIANSPEVPATAVLVGDLDSADPQQVSDWAARGRRIERHPVDKDATDLDLALQLATSGLDDSDVLIVVGGDGAERFDHLIGEIAVVVSLKRRVSIVYGPALVEVLHGFDEVALFGASGDVVSLVPWGGPAKNVRTRGLRWALHDERLALGSSRGMSNELTDSQATVSVGSGSLLVIQPTALVPGEPLRKNFT